MHKLKTKSIYDPEETDDGVRVLVAQIHPKNGEEYYDKYNQWYRALAPSSKLEDEYKNGNMDWKRFREEYLREIYYNRMAQRQLLDLVKMLESVNVTLLCYEKEDENCHRHIIKDLIEQGYNNG